jgi:NAD(P) transhydrogenase subunit alpha
MKLGIPRETVAGETRVATTPDIAKKLVSAGFDVVLERGAGELAHYPDADYESAGVRLGDASDALGCDIVAKVRKPSVDEAGQFADGGLLHAKGVTVLAMERMPRISRAQSMDALSSQSNIAGYRAVIEARPLRALLPDDDDLGRLGQAGALVVLGAGVAGCRRSRRRAGWAPMCTPTTSARDQGADRVARRQGHRAGSRRERRRRGRLCQGAVRRGQGQAAGAAGRRAGQGPCHHHHRADPLPAGAGADHRGGGRAHAHRLGDRRPGRGQRRQLQADRAGPGGRAPRRVIVGHTNYPAMVPSDASAFYAKNLANLLEIMVDKSDAAWCSRTSTEDEITKAMRTTAERLRAPRSLPLSLCHRSRNPDV